MDVIAKQKQSVEIEARQPGPRQFRKKIYFFTSTQLTQLNKLQAVQQRERTYIEMPNCQSLRRLQGSTNKPHKRERT
jgi:hypothetical protein